MAREVEEGIRHIRFIVIHSMKQDRIYKEETEDPRMDLIDKCGAIRV